MKGDIDGVKARKYACHGDVNMLCKLAVVLMSYEQYCLLINTAHSCESLISVSQIIRWHTLNMQFLSVK